MSEYFDPYDPTGGGNYGGGGGGLGDGDNGGGFGVVTTPAITQVQLAEGGILALAYGTHIVAGHLILHQKSAPQTILQALGAGPWASCERLLYKGQDVPPGDFHFHKGTRSTGDTDPVQGIDSFFPGGLTYSETSYVAMRLPSAFANDDPPDQLRGIFKCLEVADYDENGNELVLGVDGFGQPIMRDYSHNQARVAADLILVQAGMEKRRIDWRSWHQFKKDCAEKISWDDGTGPRLIDRFECHTVFTSGVSLAEALDAVMATCAGVWQDDGEKIRFYSPLAQKPVHHFHAGNIVSDSVSYYRRGATSRPNLARAKFRDLDSEFLTEASAYIERPELREAVGVIEAPTKILPNMRHSQAQRLLVRQMRLDTDNPLIYELTGLGDSFHVLPGDFVTFSWSELELDYQLCLVVDAEEVDAETAPDHGQFVLQAIDGPLYRDSDHGPVQRALEV